MEVCHKKLRIKDQDEATLADRYKKVMKRKNDRQKKLYHLKVNVKKQASEREKKNYLDRIFLEMQGNGLSLNSNAAVLLYIKSQPVYKPRINKRFLEQYRHIWL